MSVSILGSTGSIGRQTLEVCNDLGIQVNALSANSNIDLLENQARKFNVKLVSVYDSKLALELKKRLENTNIEVLYGQQGNVAVASYSHSDTVVTAMSGMIGLIPTIEAIKSKKRIALANKETLVCAGHIIIPLAKEYGAQIIPVDSEHSAIFQCINASNSNSIKKIILTASGGPFYGKKLSDLEHIKKADALNHPNWSMGNKITIDSATLANKGLEMIEAKWLFNIPLDKIEVVIHRESIVHSAIEFEDNSIIAQLGVPKMYLPIKYALTYPKRIASGSYELSLFGKTLTFDKPDVDTFKCLELCIRASNAGGLYPTIMNAANEQAVSMFLSEKISFTRISDCIEKALEKISLNLPSDRIESVLEADRVTRSFVNELSNAQKLIKV